MKHLANKPKKYGCWYISNSDASKTEVQTEIRATSKKEAKRLLEANGVIKSDIWICKNQF